MNAVVRTLIVTDLVISSATGLIAPLMAVFVTSHLVDGSVEVAGFATMLLLLTRSVFQIPLARYADRHRAHRLFLLAGTFLSALAPFGYAFSTHAWHFYLVEAVNGVGLALSVPTWLGLFSGGLTRGKESTEWGTYSTMWGVATAAAAGVGGVAVARFGFQPTFLAVGALELFGWLLLLAFLARVPERPALWLAHARRAHGPRKLRMFYKPGEPEKPTIQGV